MFRLAVTARAWRQQPLNFYHALHYQIPSMKTMTHKDPSTV
jgi:hypothetical protein